MIEKSLADPRHQSSTTTEGNLEHIAPIAQRVLRGQRLFRQHAEAFIWKRGTWFVPSENGCAYYAVRLGPVEVCECRDFEHRGGPCKHVYSARIAQAKSVVCDCCGHRVLGRFVSEVEEEDRLLSWWVGQRVCCDCIRAGYWV